MTTYPLATYETHQDEDGSYYIILLVGRVVAYTLQEVSAQLVVKALNLCNAAAFESWPSIGKDTHQ